MDKDPYQQLGVGRDATAEDIRKAYRKLAKQYHPDLNPGNRTAEERFKAVTAAYDLLNDPEKRARYDRGEIDASGAERQQRPSYRQYADAEDEHPYASQAGYADFADLGDIFSDLFGANRGRRTTVELRGADLRYQLTVDFLEAANGARKRVTMPDGRTLDLTIPPGLQSGQSLRLKGQGLPGLGGAAAGDALVEVQVTPHPSFERRDFDIHVVLPVTLGAALLGGRVRVPTIGGPVTMRIPKRSNTGTTLRLKGKGILDRRTGRRGDQFVRLEVRLPPTADAELEAFVEGWAARHPYNPRPDPEATT